MSGESRTRASTPEGWQAQSARLALLHDVLLLMARSSSLEDLLQGAIGRIKWVLDFQRCTLALPDDAGATYRLRTLLETRRGFSTEDISPVPLDKGVPGAVIQSGRIKMFTDLSEAAERPPLADEALEGGSLPSILGVPLMAYNRVLGAITFGNSRKDAFSDEDVKFSQSFALHLALALDRWRQSRELRERNHEISEALDQQTATSEVLRAISGSPRDVQPVFDTIARCAKELCHAQFCAVFQYDGENLDFVGQHGLDRDGQEAYRNPYPRPADQDTAIGRAIVGCKPVSIPDVLADEQFGHQDAARVIGFRSIISVPMLHDGAPVGGISVSRPDPGPFSDKQIELLNTFADQAVIAISNVRTFRALETRTRELTRSVEELRALGEISNTISSSLDLDRVLQMIVTRAVELSNTDAGTIYEFDEAEEVFTPRANQGITQTLIEELRRSRQRVGDPSAIGQAGARGTPVQIPDLSTEDDYAMQSVRQAGFRSLVAVPLLHEKRIVGGLVVRRKQPGRFTDSVLDLLQRFATQSALSIQNARLFLEIQEKSAALEVASQHKSQFLANMSHELRTPLNAIIGYSEMLEDEARTLGQESFITDLKHIQTAGRHLLELINEILDLSKIEAGKMELFIERFDLTTLIREVTSTVQPLAAKNHNTLDVSCTSDLGTMHSDMTKVRQALFNLLSNACKFTREGTITLNASCEERGGKPWIRLCVQDTGIGLTSEQTSRLFQAFAQADASTTRQYGGTGLGLAISRRFCQMMGGDITVESVFGEGSTFTILLPVDPGSAATPGITGHELPGTSPAEEALPGDAPTVLVIDDDPAVRQLMRRFLGRQGMRMLDAASGEEGLQIARSARPDAITLDVLMPGMDGWQVLAALKSDPELRGIPVTVMSIVDDRKVAYGLGVSDFITKPIDWALLTEVLLKYVSDESNLSILVVEDDGQTRALFRRLLQRKGWRVREASNGRQGLAEMERDPPDVVFLDLMMPEMDGFQFVEELRGRREWGSIPVIVVTAKDLGAEERRRLSGYVEAVLEKGTHSAEAVIEELCVHAMARRGRNPASSPEAP